MLFSAQFQYWKTNAYFFCLYQYSKYEIRYYAHGDRISIQSLESFSISRKLLFILPFQYYTKLKITHGISMLINSVSIDREYAICYSNIAKFAAAYPDPVL